MVKRPGSRNGIPWFFYKIRRKIHFLRTRGTLFHRIPKHLPEPRGKRETFRKLRHLYHSGNLFKINFRGIGEFMNRNYAFLGNGKYLVVLLNSTFIFLFAYLFVFILKESATVIAAASFDIRSVMMYYDVEFMIRSRDWTEDAVKVVYSTGPLVTLMITFLAATLFSLTSQDNRAARLFVMWVILHALTQSFGEMIFGAFLNQGFGWVLAYLYFDDTEKMLFVAAILASMLAAGFFLSRFLLLTGNIDFNFLNRGNRSPFLVSQIILPYLFGTGIIFLIKQPLVNGFEFLVEGSMILIIIPALLRTRNSNELFFDEEPRKIRIRWYWISAAIVALLLFRILFWKGVRIY